MENQVSVPGKGSATASLVLGIISVALCVAGKGAIASVVCGIIGIVLASKSKKAGFTGGTRKAGLILSIIGLIVGAIVFVSCVACASALASAVQDAM